MKVFFFLLMLLWTEILIFLFECNFLDRNTCGPSKGTHFNVHAQTHVWRRGVLLLERLFQRAHTDSLARCWWCWRRNRGSFDLANNSCFQRAHRPHSYGSLRYNTHLISLHISTDLVLCGPYLVTRLRHRTMTMHHAVIVSRADHSFLLLRFLAAATGWSLRCIRSGVDHSSSVSCAWMAAWQSHRAHVGINDLRSASSVLKARSLPYDHAYSLIAYRGAALIFS